MTTDQPTDSFDTAELAPAEPTDATAEQDAPIWTPEDGDFTQRRSPYADRVRRDPYRVLGISPGASAEEMHDAYREMVKRHHPDRNGGSPESTRRFQEIQEAYDELRARPVPPPRSDRHADPSVSERMATLERELRDALAARERAKQTARDAVRDSGGSEPAPVSSEDSFGKILGDVRDELADRVGDARRHPAVKRVSDLIDGLDDLASRLDRR